MAVDGAGDHELAEDEKALIAVLGKAVGREFGDDARRIAHAHSVLGHALAIMREEGGDARVVIAAGLLHDIGIREAERKHGSSAGVYQETEGPPIARRIMEELDLDPGVMDHVCRIIANHHSARDIDTLEFRVLWDADWLVNLPAQHPNASRAELEQRIGQLFKTAAGAARARKLLIGPG